MSFTDRWWTGRVCRASDFKCKLIVKYLQYSWTKYFCKALRWHYQSTVLQTCHTFAFTSDSIRWQCLNIRPLFLHAVWRDFINMTWGTFSLTYFLSHDIMAWYWQAPTSCSMLWDFTGKRRRLNTQTTLTVAPHIFQSRQLHFCHISHSGTNICEISQVISDGLRHSDLATSFLVTDSSAHLHCESVLISGHVIAW